VHRWAHRADHICATKPLSKTEFQACWGLDDRHWYLGALPLNPREGPSWYLDTVFKRSPGYCGCGPACPRPINNVAYTAPAISSVKIASNMVALLDALSGGWLTLRIRAGWHTARIRGTEHPNFSERGAVTK
jgi:hypothetical protein